MQQLLLIAQKNIYLSESYAYCARTNNRTKLNSRFLLAHVAFLPSSSFNLFLDKIIFFKVYQLTMN